MSVGFGISEVFPASCEAVYETWLDSEGHVAMARSPAVASGEVGGEFRAWDGDITGKNLELTPGNLIRQSWRTQDFDGSEQDSELVITLEAEGSGTRLTLKHTNLPESGMHYKKGWIDHYFEPMKARIQI